MLDFFANHWGSMLIGMVLLAMVILIVVKMRKDKKKGQCSCGCNCKGCPSSGMCHKQ